MKRKTPKIIKTVVEEFVKTKEITLEGGELRVVKLRNLYEIDKKSIGDSETFLRNVAKRFIEENEEVLKFVLVKVNPEEIEEFRNRGIPSFVLKKDKKFYYAQIDPEINFYTADILGAHKCAVNKHECSRLSAASDENGGCQKVRDIAPNKKIEKYPWITAGYETFNTNHDAFVVISCLNYEEIPSKRTVSIKELN